MTNHADEANKEIDRRRQLSVLERIESKLDQVIAGHKQELDEAKSVWEQDQAKRILEERDHYREECRSLCIKLGRYRTVLRRLLEAETGDVFDSVEGHMRAEGLDPKEV